MAEEAPDVRGRWAWLAPVMGCFLVLMVVSGATTNHLGYLSTASPTDWPATVARNQSYAAYIEASFHSEQNSPRNEPIAWTNAAGVPRGPRLVPSRVTNSLIVN